MPSHERHHDIDWLRSIAVWLLIPIHTASIYLAGEEIYVLRSDERSLLTDITAAFLNIWQMPLLMLLAGMGSYYALKKRNAKNFLEERFFRLFVPLVFGTLVCVPPMVYCQRLQDGSFTGSFFAFYPKFFKGLHPKGNFTYGHLWFLFYLFIFSIICLPLFTKIYRSHGSAISGWLMKFAERRGALLFLCIVFVVIEVCLRASFPGRQYFINDWANVLRYLLLCSFGFFYAATPALRQAVKEQRRIWLAAGLVGLIVVTVIAELELLIPKDELLPPLRYTPGFLIIVGIYGGPVMWATILALLGYAQQHLNFDHAILRRFVPIALPFYVVHQAILIPTGYLTLQAGYSLYPAFFIICLVSFNLTWLVVDFGLRPWRIPRLCLGMKEN